MNSATLRIGIVGAGANARDKHLPRLQAIQDVEVVAVANRSETSAQRVADEFGIPRVYGDWRELLRDEATDAIVVGTRPELHRDVTIAALEAGNHVLTEARLARTAAEAREILAAARAHPAQVVQVVPAGFSLEQDVTIRRLVDTELGELVAVEGTFHDGDFVDPDAPLHWRQDRHAVGVNVMTVGRRYENLLRWLPPVTEVLAGGQVTVTERFDPDRGCQIPVELPDIVTIVGRYGTGAHLDLFISSVTGHGPPPTFRLYGSAATIVFDGAAGTIDLGRRGMRDLQPVAVPPEEWFPRRVVDEFVEAIRGQRAVWRTRLSDAVAYMEFADAVHRSLSSGHWETVPAVE